MRLKIKIIVTELTMYCFKHVSKELYVHYNPSKKEYFIHDKLLGCVVFEYDKGIEFKNLLNLVDFQLKKISDNIEITKTSIGNEQTIYDLTS